MLKKKFQIVVSLVLMCVSSLFAQSVVLTDVEVEQINKNNQEVTLWKTSLEKVKLELAPYLEKGVDVPTPKDLAGGYTHSQHKKNYFLMQKAGVMFQLTGKEEYAEFVKTTLEKYLESYPTWERHPSQKSYARGKIFWQCLNDANWLVYTSQAYGSIYTWLSKKERKKFNEGLFIPMADFLSVETPHFFNRLHNHSTWANAGVGMIGLVMNNEELIQKALYGLPLTNKSATDNDGGAIQKEGQKEAGFLAQIDHSFSPDGYYTEGPYYQRYAMYPFLIFALSLEHLKPEMKIFEYRNGVLIKAVNALLQQTNANGEFFPLNDAQKGMSYYSIELQLALALGYQYGSQDEGLLSLIQLQNRAPLNYAGWNATKAISEGKGKSFEKKSIYLSDGANGDKGGIAVLRNQNAELIMKFSQHGMGHGHFDRLSYSLNFNGEEVLQDYGAARFVNIHQKDGGGYLKENKTWAKQTIAHNTIVVDSKSQFNAKVKTADTIAPEDYIFSIEDAKLQVTSAKENNAYEGIKLHRTLALIEQEGFENPLVLDLYIIDAEEEHTYDLPFHYHGQLMSSTITLKQNTTLEPLGEKYGYQHLWNQANGQTIHKTEQVNWFDKTRFYTLSFASKNGDQLTKTQLGANDPDFNLRNDPSLIYQRKGSKGRNTLVSILETHGSYSTVTEASKNTYTNIKNLEISFQTDEYIAVNFSNKQNEEWTFILSTVDNSTLTTHEITIGNEKYKWGGPFALFKNELEQ